jgi:hypothetical protein
MRIGSNICQGCSINIKMRVPQDGVCPQNLKSMGPFARQEVLVRPQNGIYGSANETATAYRPNSGFLGRDYFETRLFFEDGSGKRTTMTVKVNVCCPEPLSLTNAEPRFRMLFCSSLHNDSRCGERMGKSPPTT